jgi:hypothetical protein
MRQGEISAMPDVISDRQAPGMPLFRVAQWSYIQAPTGILMEDGTLFVLFNGGAKTVPEANYGTRYPVVGTPQHFELWSSDGITEGESGLYGVCRTPASWPDDKRWLMGWSGSWQKDWGQPRAYRVWCGLATASSLDGTWVRKQEGIFSTKVIPQGPPPFEWWPNGTWCVAPLTVNGKVYCIVRDNSYAEMPKGPVHLVYEVHPDLSVKRVGTIHPSDATIYSWFCDAALGADGKLYALDGQESNDAATVGTRTREYATSDPWVPESDAILAPTGRTWVHQQTPTTTATFDGGYLKTPEGVLVEPRCVFTNLSTKSGDWTLRGNMRIAWFDESGAYADRLSLTVPPLPLGWPAGMVETVWLPWRQDAPRFPGHSLGVWPSPGSDCYVNWYIGGKRYWTRIEAIHGAEPVESYGLIGWSVQVPIDADAVGMRGYCHANLYDGGVGTLWPRLVQRLDGPCVFWGG